MGEALGNRPDPDQLLLLHAALDASEAAARAWRRWRSAVGVEGADEASRRLLPLLYARRLEGAGELREAYRAAWIRNRLLFERAAGAIQALEGTGIRTLTIKGASLALLAYGDIGAREMDDVDLLVPLSRAVEAIDVLREAGWVPDCEDPLSRVGVHHSLGFAGPGGGNVDLHWFSLWQPADDEPLWRASVPLEMAGTATRAPCSADQLLLVCVHGASWSRLPSLRWIVDAMAVIRAEGGGMAWDRLATEAERRRLTVAASAALGYLSEEFGAPVPESLVAQLDRVPAPRHERAAFRASCRPDGPTRTGRMAWDRYRRLRDLDTGVPPPSGFLPFARRFWGLESAWRLPWHAASSLARRRARSSEPS